MYPWVPQRQKAFRTVGNRSTFACMHAFFSTHSLPPSLPSPISSFLSLDRSLALLSLSSPDSPGSCDESFWPDKDHGLICGECKVLVDNFDSIYQTCDGYCASIRKTCVGAWEEDDDSCQVDHDMTCEQTLDSSDAICQCSPDSASGLLDLCKMHIVPQRIACGIEAKMYIHM